MKLCFVKKVCHLLNALEELKGLFSCGKSDEDGSRSRWIMNKRRSIDIFRKRIKNLV